jgi:hypothetical protein
MFKIIFSLVSENFVAILTITISALALLLSVISIFLQFFYRPRRLRAITMAPTFRETRSRFGICNASKESIYITGLSVNYSIPWHHGTTKEYPVDDVQRAASIVSPGSIVEFSYAAKGPPKEFLRDAPESVNLNGEHERTVDIVVFIQFTFPDGKVFSNWFKAGSYRVAENSNSETVRGVNLDLLESALPVIDKKV